jgi:hypothetical protein
MPQQPSSSSPSPGQTPAARTRGQRLLRGCGFGCLGAVVLGVGAVICIVLFLSKVPKTYPAVAQPIPPPTPERNLGGNLDGFASPYLGHTGSWDGKGGGMGGGSKTSDMDQERAMGLRWTFMPVYWRAMEPAGPVDLTAGTPPAWMELDTFVIAAHDRSLNVLMQAPVIGGNSGGPPQWAGRRQPGKAAPANMDAAVEFAVRLVSRYRPNGTLAQQQGWGASFGVRAWEIDNEPEGFRTNWKGQAPDYAELVTKAAARIKQVDPLALILAPAVAGGGHGSSWVEEALNGGVPGGTSRPGMRYSIGRPTDVVSFHCYEGLETDFAGEDRTIERDFSEIRATFEKWENCAPGLDYNRKEEYWQTEGNFDFLGVLSAKRRAAWRWQFFTRAFAAGIRKVNVMDASAPERTAVRAYVGALPNPFPMAPASNGVRVVSGQAVVFRHWDSPAADAGQVWIVWAAPDADDAMVEIPVLRQRVMVLSVDGNSETVPASQGRVMLHLQGDAKMTPGMLVIDRIGN